MSRIEEAEVPHDLGATSTANWLAHHTQLTRREAHRQVRLAAALARCDQTRVALAQRRLHIEHAEVIVWALDRPPEDLDPEEIARAEAHLIVEAAHHDRP